MNWVPEKEGKVLGVGPLTEGRDGSVHTILPEGTAVSCRMRHCHVRCRKGLPGRLPDPGVGVGFGVRGLHCGRYSTEWTVTQPLASPVDFTRVGLPGVEFYLPFSSGEISLCASNDTPPKRDISLILSVSTNSLPICPDCRAF